MLDSISPALLREARGGGWVGRGREEEGKGEGEIREGEPFLRSRGN